MKSKSYKITVRRATMKDLDTLVDQRHMMAEDIRHRQPREHNAADIAYRNWVLKMTKKKRFVGFLSVRDNGEVAGGGCVWLKEFQPFPGSGSTTGPYLMSMYTRPKYRGRGIATSIVKEAMKWSKLRGYKVMTLHASEYGRSVYAMIGWKRTWEMRIDLNSLQITDDSDQRK